MNIIKNNLRDTIEQHIHLYISIYIYLFLLNQEEEEDDEGNNEEEEGELRRDNVDAGQDDSVCAFLGHSGTCLFYIWYITWIGNKE